MLPESTRDDHTPTFQDHTHFTTDSRMTTTNASSPSRPQQQQQQQQQQESGPATKRIRMGTPGRGPKTTTSSVLSRRTLEEKSNIDEADGSTTTTITTTTTTTASGKSISGSTRTATTAMTNGGDGIMTRRERLDDFAKQNKMHYEKTAQIGRHPDGVVLTKPVRPKCQAAPNPILSQQPHQRPVIPIATSSKPIKKPPTDHHHPSLHHNHHLHHPHHHHHHHHPGAYRGPELTPVRIKPRFKKEDVEATNDGYAPVAKLAAWLADNPTSNKKVACVRKGANVIAKSRKFERDLENVIIEESGIEVGGVTEKKQWLKSAFSSDGSESTGPAAPLVNVSDKRKWLAHAFKRGDDDNDDDDDDDGHLAAAETASEILSVTDKKKWLETAFKKQSQGGDYHTTLGNKNVAGKAMSMVNMPRSGGGGLHDDATTRAKKKWQENSARRLAARKSASSGATDLQQQQQQQQQQQPTEQQPTEQQPEAGKANGTPAIGSKGMQESSDTDGRREYMRTMQQAAEDMVWEAEGASSVGHVAMHDDATKPKVEEDKTPVDFRAARELLIQRSKQNGNPLSVVSKVQRRKQIFERIDKENKRRSGQYGLLRPSWEPVAEPVEGPTTAYKKTYVEDIVPKKSFEELP